MARGDSPAILENLRSVYSRAFIESLAAPDESSRFEVKRHPLPMGRPEVSFYAFPELPSRGTVLVFCSIIHVPSAIVLLLAQHHLRHTGCPLEVLFFTTSSHALRGFVEATRSGRPALITVTEGTAGILDSLARAGEVGFASFLEVQPGSLRWTSPVAHASSRDLAELRGGPLTLVHVDHPTDVLAVERFRAAIGRRRGTPPESLQIETRRIEDVPERIDIYRAGPPGELFLTERFMDRWALRGASPAVARGWRQEERRFLYGNQPLWELRDRKGRWVAHWLQRYLRESFVEILRTKRSFVDASPRIGGEALLAHGLRYLGVVD